MDAKEVLAIVLNRGLQPKIGGLGVLDFDGDPKGMTPALLDAVKYHEVALLRLVASNWTPPTRGPGATPIVPLTPSSEAQRFDWEAERLIRDLYATDHGIKWKPSGMAVWPQDGDPRLAQWLKRASPMRDRIEAHIRPRDVVHGPHKQTHGIELQHKDGGKTIKVPYPIRQRPERARKAGDEEIKGTPESNRMKHRQAEQWPIIGQGFHDYTTQTAWIYVVEEDHVFQWEPPILFTAWRYMADRCEYWRQLWGRHLLFGNRWEWCPWGSRREDGGRFA